MADMTRDEFRDGLLNALLVAKRLAPHCADSIADMTGLIELAIGVDGEGKGNEAQLKILMNLVIPQEVKVQRRA